MKVFLHLNDPGATYLHKAGIAGLGLSLQKLQELYPERSQRPGNLEWLILPESLSLAWKEASDFEVLDWLLKQAFRIDPGGLISPVGIDTFDPEVKLAFHRGITKTFLQHNKSVKLAGSGYIEIGKPTTKIFYKKVQSYAHQNFAKHLCDEQGNLQKCVRVVSWLFPGLIVRHEAVRNYSVFEEKVERAIALLFAPLACTYFTLNSCEYAAKNHCLLVVPDVENLLFFSEFQLEIGSLGYNFFCASNPSDAALKFLIQISKGIDNSTALHRCYIALFSNTAWSPQQLTRVFSSTIETSKKLLKTYRNLLELSQEYSKEISEEKILCLSFIHQAISDNIVHRKPWWSDFFEKISQHGLLNEFLFYGDLITKMLGEVELDLEIQELFIEACHEGLKRIYAKTYDRAKDGEAARIDRVNNRLFYRLKYCSNSDQFRSFLSAFLGEAGGIPTLAKDWRKLLPITTGKTNWKLSRDLFLIALASYPGKYQEKVAVANQ